MFSEFGVRSVFFHIEYTLIPAEGAGDIMIGLVGQTVIDQGQFSGVADQEECGGDT